MARFKVLASQLQPGDTFLPPGDRILRSVVARSRSGSIFAVKFYFSSGEWDDEYEHFPSDAILRLISRAIRNEFTSPWEYCEIVQGFEFSGYEGERESWTEHWWYQAIVKGS